MSETGVSLSETGGCLGDSPEETPPVLETPLCRSEAPPVSSIDKYLVMIAKIKAIGDLTGQIDLTYGIARLFT